MAGDWIKMECCTPEKAEVLAITARMGWDDVDVTVGKLFRMWRWFDQQTEGGNARGVTAALLDRVIGVTGFCEAVQSVGWIEINEDGITLPNFDRHNGTTAKSRALGAKRTAKSKNRSKGNAEGNAPGDAKGNARTVTSPSPREEKRREEVEPDGSTPSIPHGLDLPTWERWVEYRKRIGKALKPASMPAAQKAMAAFGDTQAAVVEQSIANGWQGLFALKSAQAMGIVNRQAAVEQRNQAAVDEWLAQQGVVHEAD